MIRLPWMSWLGVVLLLLPLGAEASALEFQAGSFSRYLTDGPDQATLRGEIYAEPRIKFGEDLGPAWLVLSGRFRSFLDPESKTARFDVRDSYLNIEKESLRARLGFQSLSWGETFGFFIADLPNPREWRDPILLDLAYTKKPVFMASAQWFGDWLGQPASLEVFFTPITRRSDFLQDLDASLPGERSYSKIGRDSEAGVRASRVWGFGLDSSVFAVSHFDRNAVFNPSRVLSVGGTASQALGTEWVLRTDQVFRRPLDRLQWQGVLGVDWSPTSSFTLGAQLQHEEREIASLWGSSLRAMCRGIRDRWDLEAFVFGGFDQSEFWFQPRITYNHPAGFSASVRYDWLDGSLLGEGFLNTVTRSDRGMLVLGYRL